MKKTLIASLTVLALSAVAGLAGCSDNNPTSTVPQEIEFAELLVEAILEDAVLPVVQGISGPLQANLPAVLGGSSRVQCTELGCATGVGELCETGVDHYFATYDRCDIDGLRIDGSLLLSGDSTAATWTVDLKVNGARMSGTAIQILTGSCTDTSFTDFQISAPAFFGFLAGSFEYCGGPWFSGSMSLDAEVFGAGDFVVDLGFDGSSVGGAQVSFDDGTTFAACSTDLEAVDAACDFP